MCTVTWLQSEHGYHLFSNRDESRKRGRARLPRVFEENGVRYLAAQDSDAGGTWLAINEWGLTATLLNAHPMHSNPAPQDDPEKPYVSRGKLITALAGATDCGDAAAALDSFDVSRLRPFTVAVFDPQNQPWVRNWDGRTMTSPEVAALQLESFGACMLTSSSFKGAEVAASRRQDLQQRLRSASPAGAAEQILEFHRSHEPEKGPFSTCMHRPDAASVSLTWIEIGRDHAAVRYADGSPCRAELGTPVILPLRSTRPAATQPAGHAPAP